MKFGVQGTLIGFCLVMVLTGIYFPADQKQTAKKSETVEPPDGYFIKLAATIVPARIQHVYPPVGGQIREMLVEEGAHVQAGQVLARIGDLSRMEATIEIPETLLDKIHQGQKCVVIVDSSPGITFSGSVSHIRPIVSSQTRTVTVRVKIDLHDQKSVLPGSFGHVEIPSKE